MEAQLEDLANPKTFLQNGNLKDTSGDTAKAKPSRISRTSMRLALAIWVEKKRILLAS